MNESSPTSPPETKPSAVKHQEFGIAVALVVLTGALGFFGNKPQSGINLPLAITVTVVISAGFCMRQFWARHAAMLVAAFTTVVSALDLADKAVPATPITWVKLVVGSLTFYWLLRDGVKAWFATSSKDKPKID